MSEEIVCPWCGETVSPETKVLQRKQAEVVERSCSRCGKVISAYLSGEKFLDMIRERVMNFKE